MMSFIQEQNKKRKDYQFSRQASPIIDFCQNRTTKGVILVSVFAIVVPVLVYYFVIQKAITEEEDVHSCAIKSGYKVPCGKIEKVTFEYCTSIYCCFDSTTNLCFHYLPSKYYYYQEENIESYQPSLQQSPFKRSLTPAVSISINELDENRLQIILHKEDISVSTNTIENAKFNYTISSKPLEVDVFRAENNKRLLTTGRGALIISENYWEWSFQLGNDTNQTNLFGLGQILIDVKPNTTLTKVIYPNSQDHTTLPTFMAGEDGQYHGVIVRHQGPLEVTVLPSNLVILKFLAEDQIILELCVGDTPQNVRKQQLQERKQSKDVDFWTLGVHVCRNGDIGNLKELLEEYESFPSKYDSDCIHDNLALALLGDKNFDATSLLGILEKLETDQKKFLLSLPPQVVLNSAFYNNSLPNDIFYTYMYGNVSDDYYGLYRGKNVSYPNFLSSTSSDYVSALFSRLLATFADDKYLNNIILSENWPSDESFQMTETEDFQYMSEALLSAMSSTIPWNATSHNQTHFSNHNKYGRSQLEAIVNGFTTPSDDRFIMSATNDVDLFYPVVVENLNTSWTNFQDAISKMLYNSVFNHPLIGIPVCGSTATFDKVTHEQLCIRWYLMASTSPFFRISSESRFPNSLNTLTATNLALRAIDIRYQLQYYYHWVLKIGEPLTRPMFYEFPTDNNTYGLNTQYMVGDSILVAHPTLPDQTSLKIYLPGGIWYEIWGGTPYNESWIELSVVESDWIGFVPEGKIVPLVDTILNRNAVTLMVAPSCSNSTCTAFGAMSSDTFEVTFTLTDRKISAVANSDIDFVLDRVVRYNIEQTADIVECIETAITTETSIDLDHIPVCPTTTTTETTINTVE